jgi:alpha-N-arabinofuranosidase
MKYQNPIIRGFNPDPSICKVGDEYYLVTSSFEYFPGIPLYLSTDLVNWRQIGNCINHSDQLPMEKAYPSGGIWAPTIRHHEGMLYVTSTFSELGNFIIRAQVGSMAWSDPVWIDIGGIDPSLFFADGKVYYCTNQRSKQGEQGISLVEIDITTGELLSEVKYIWSGMNEGFVEAPHIYCLGDWYYLLVAEGGTFSNHMINLARSKDIWGPYEACPDNPILTNRNDVSKAVMGTGHGDLVFDHEDNLWMVFLGTRPSTNRRSHLGRETFLAPMKLAEGWIFAENRMALIENEGPPGTRQNELLHWEDDFSKKDFGPEWLFIGRPDVSKYYRDGKALTLTPTANRLIDADSPTFVAVRPLDMDFDVDTAMDFATVNIGDEAGLVLYLNPQFHYKFAKRREADGEYIVVHKIAEDFEQISYHRQLAGSELKLLIKARKDKFEFFYSEENGGIINAGNASTRFLAVEVADKCFTGMLIGLYAQCAETSATKAIFHHIKQEVMSNDII